MLDFKKEYKEFYLPKATPEIVTVPSANYIAVRGEGVKTCKATAGAVLPAELLTRRISR